MSFCDHVFRYQFPIMLSSILDNLLNLKYNHVFRTLDTDGNGYLDFKEFIMANDLIAAQNKEAKLSWAFKM